MNQNNTIALAKLEYLAHGGVSPEAGTAAAGEALAAQYLLDKTGTADDVAALADWQWHHNRTNRAIVALEQIAAALVAHDTTAPATRTLTGVSFDEPRREANYMLEMPVAFEYGIYGMGGLKRWDDDGKRAFYVDLDPDFNADSPSELREIAEQLRTNVATALDVAADRWEQLEAQDKQEDTEE